MTARVLVLLAFFTSVACGQTGSDDKAAGKPSAAPAPKVDAGSDAAPAAAAETTDKVVRTDKEWRKLLTREQFEVLRMKGTERPFRNKYDRHFEPGTYACAACGQELFSSDTKFDSGCGWPAFYAARAGDRVQMTPDLSQGMVRVEVTCARCGSHLGHVFDDAPKTPTGQRFCINSLSLKFIPADAKGKDRDAQVRGQAKQGDQRNDQRRSKGKR